MKDNLSRLVIIFLLTLLVSPSIKLDVQAAPLKEGSQTVRHARVADEILVRFKGDQQPFRRIRLPRGQTIEEALTLYRQNPQVEYAEPNYIAYALLVPNDEYYSYQWHLDNPTNGGVQAEAAWDIATGSGVTVAIVDGGVAYEDYCQGIGWWATCYEQAPDLAETCFVAGYDFVNNDSHPNDDTSPGHGTHVAGTVAQSTNNSLGVAGLAFDACLMPVKVLGSNGSGTYADVANGIRYAVDNGAHIINLSLGGSAPSLALEQAVAYAYQQGVTVVAASGNDNSSAINYPAGYDDYVIAVGATRFDQTRAPYSNYGISLDLVAPGGDLTVDQDGDGYKDGVLQQTYVTGSRGRISWSYYFLQGTSMASPHVAGLAALLRSNGNATMPDEVRSALQETAVDLGDPGRDDYYGYGLINAVAALGWSAGPACTTNTDCDDSLECTTDICTNPGTAEAACTNEALPNGLACTEGICCSGECATLACTADADCDDGLACTINTCLAASTCSASCQLEEVTVCQNDDGCCPATCNSVNDNDCPETPLVACWEAEFEYLYRNRSQARKFCKCAQGTYGYQSYNYERGRQTVYRYQDTSDNEIWDIATRSSFTYIDEVICTDEQSYPTNVTYFYSSP